MSKRRPTKKLYTDHNMHTHTQGWRVVIHVCVDDSKKERRSKGDSVAGGVGGLGEM